MKRRLVDVVRIWALLTPAVLRVGLRRVRRSSLRRVSPSVAIEPIVIDGREVGMISTHDDPGTSTAETLVTLAPDLDLETAQNVIETRTLAAFARGNHRAAWTVCDDQLAVIGMLKDSGFTHEGSATPPFGDTRGWQAWSRLSTEVPSTSDTEVPSKSGTEVPSTSGTEVAG